MNRPLVHLSSNILFIPSLVGKMLIGLIALCWVDTAYSDQTYPVSGSNLQQVYNNLHHPEAAEFHYELHNTNYEYLHKDAKKTTNPDKSCTYTITAAVDPKAPFNLTETHYTLMPVWTQSNGACRSVLSEWTRFLGTLAAHEAHHGQILSDFMSGRAQAIDDQVNAATANGSGATLQAASDAADAALDQIVNPMITGAKTELDKLEQQYDTDSAGSLVLDVGITCK